MAGYGANDKLAPEQTAGGGYGPNDRLAGEPPKATGVFRKAADWGLGIAEGAASGVKALADVAGAGNVVSDVAGIAAENMQELMSPQALADKQEQQRILAESKDKGVLNQIGAGARAFAVAPGQTIATGVGSLAPIIAASLLPGGVVPAVATGVGMGVGGVKGGIYDDVKARTLAAGKSDSEAESAAQAAQSYTGKNADQIALGGALGALDPLVGAGKAATGLLRAGVGRGVNPGQAGGMVRRAATGAGVEGAQEFVQGGQQQFATNLGANRAGFDVDPMQGVVGQGTLEALAGAGVGGGLGVFNRPSPPPVQAPPPAAPPAGPLTQAAMLALPAPVVHVDGSGRAKMDGVPSGGFDTGQQEGAVGRTDTPLTSTARDLVPSDTINVDGQGNASPPPQPPAGAPPRQQGEPGPRETGAMGAGRNSESANFPLAGDIPPPQYRGPLATAAGMAPSPSAGADITDNGQPFRNGIQAARAAKQAGPGFRPVPVDGGFVVRRDTSDAQDVEIKQPKDSANAVQQRLPAPAAATTDSSPAGERPSTGPVSEVRGPAGAPTVQSVTGRQLDDRWTAFSPDSGTKAIPRATMPQVKAEHRGALVNFLNARGITHEQVDVPAQDLKPTQAEFSPKKVQQARDFTGGDRSILVSSDGHILDGHHQWVAALESGKPVKAIRLNAPIDQLVTMTRRFPSAETAGAVPSSAPDAGAAPAGQAAQGIAPTSGAAGAADVQPGVAPAAAVAPAPPAKGLRIGITPNDAEPVTVRNGVVYLGNTALQNYDTAEDVTVPEGANELQIRKAIIDSGALTKKQKFFGAAVAREPASQQNPPAPNNPQKAPSEQSPSASTTEGKADTPGRQGKPAEAAPVPTPAPAEPKLVKVMTVFGTNTYVRDSDLTGPPGMIRMYTADGKNNGRIQRENLDPTGEKRAANAADDATNPLFNVVTRKDGTTFSNPIAAKRELNVRGLQATHEVAPASEVQAGAAGFVVRRKAAQTLDSATSAPTTPTPKSPRATTAAPKPDPLTEQEKAAKAKMLNAAAKLAQLLSKNTRASITPEQEQAMLPIVIELFEGAMDLGYVKFKQAARYVRKFIADAIDQDAADAIPLDTLQGAYIATARRHQGKDITPKGEVVTTEMADVLAEDEPNASAALAPSAATHQDPGEAPEPATPAVIAESLKTAAKEEDRKPSAMKAELLARIDEAITEAPDYTEYQDIVKRMGLKDANALYTKDGGSFGEKFAPDGYSRPTRTFDVEGDGKFTVNNTVRQLLTFREKVERSPGFKDGGQKPVKLQQNGGSQNGSGGKMAAVVNMIEEGDFEAAREYAEAVGIKLEDVKVPRGERKPQWDTYLKDGTLPPPPDTRPLLPQRTPAQIAEYERQAQEAERRRPKDSGWNMAGTGFAGKRYRGRNITLADGREVVARIYENAGNYDEVEVKVDGTRKFTVRDSFNAQDKADAFIRTLTAGAESAIDLKGFTRVPRGNDAFDLIDGKLRVEVDPTDMGKFQARVGSAKSSPHLQGEQAAVDWAAQYREDAAAKSVAQPKPTAAPATKIEDFGQKLEGARKDYAATLKDAEAVDIAAEPLSKSWPEPDYDKMLAGGADPYVVAFVHAARDEVPTKPQKGWKLKGWVQSVETLRGASKKLLAGEISKDRVQTMLNDDAFGAVRRAVGSRAELYELVGHAKSLKGVTFAEHHYSLYKGQENVRKWVVEQKAKATAFGNWPRELAVADTKQAMLDQFAAKFMADQMGDDGTPKAPNKGQFIIYRKRNQEGAFIGKKIGREYIDLKKLPDVVAARSYLESNTADLSAALERYKDTPFERNPENRPRVGEDHRNGAAVTPEVFAETFGFRGVQFGNYVEQDRRQSDLNQTFDALMDMAAVLGVPPRALSLNGRLGLAFGARGKGGRNAPAAHYEPGSVVINLTKGNGPGSLGHEWWHAVDNYFGKEFGEGGFATDGALVDRLRAEMQAAFKAVRNATQVPTLRKRAAELDKRRSKPYWNTPLELSARAFESYLIAKLNDQSAANDYLANVVDEKVWNLSEEARATFFGGEAVETYPYPGQAELPAVRAAFDEFFKVVETREDDAGNVAMFSRDAQLRRGDPTVGRELRVTEIQQAVSRLSADWLRRPDIYVIDSMDDAPGPVREKWLRQNSQGVAGSIEGFHYRGQVYLVADALVDEADVRRVLFHESIGHYGLRNAFPDLKSILAQVATMRAGLVKTKAAQYGLNIEIESERLMAAEEVLAEMAQSRPEIGWVQRAISLIRRTLRKLGFTLRLSDADIISDILMPARNWVERGSGRMSAESIGFSRGSAPDDISRAKKLYEEGATLDETSRDMGRPVGTVYGWLKAAGVKMRPTSSPTLDEQTAAAVVEAYQSGQSTVKIGQLFGVHPSTVAQYLERAGVPRRKPGPPQDRVQEAKRLYDSGLSLEEVGDQLGTSDTAIYAWLKSAGVQLRPKPGYSNDLKEEAVRLYSEGMSAPEVSRRLGLGKKGWAVRDWAAKAGIARTLSEATSIAVKNGRVVYSGINTPWQSEKTGRWEMAHSTYELLRMAQLDADQQVTDWTKKTPLVPYVDPAGKARTYVPDFLVTYSDGRRVVEEVKPEFQLSEPAVKAKLDAARELFKGQGVEFRVLTQHDIGTDSIKEAYRHLRAAKAENAKDLEDDGQGSLFSRQGDQTDSPAFRAWFAGSKVVRNDLADMLAEPDGARVLIDDLLAAQGTSGASLDPVQALMLALSQNDKIGRAVVGLVPVDVVNSLAKNGVRPKDGGGNRAVFIDALNSPVSDKVLSTFRGVLTNLSAKLSDAITTGRDQELAPALRASDFNLREVGGLLSLQGRTNLGGGNGGIVSVGADQAAKTSAAGGGSPTVNAKLGAAEFADLLNKFMLLAPHAKDSISDDLPSAENIAQQGKPLVVYHGTNADVSEFAPRMKVPRKTFYAGELGSWFGSTPGVANRFADKANGAVYPVFLAVQNPREFSSYRKFLDFVEGRRSATTVRAELEREGYDGLVIRGSMTDGAEQRDDWIAFRPEQIKSATGNRGTFAPENPDIRFSRSTRSEAINSAVDHLNTLVRDVPGKLSWWHKTVGTMQNLSLRSKPFKRVYDGVQNFINDVSFYATEAADLAPTILPKLETWSDLAKSPLSAEDTKALQAPVFEGTLKWTRAEDGQPVEEPDPQKAGIVWTDAELRSRFGLDARQIGLYRETRAALDKSLSNLAVSDMLRFAGRDAQPIAQDVMESQSVGEAADTLGRYLRSLADADPLRAGVLNDTADKIDAKAFRAQDLIRRGYAPLSRFGTYTLEATLPTGERYFGMFETAAERSKMLRTLNVARATEISEGTISQEAYKIFAGVSPETLELFGDLLGLESQGDGPGAKAFQEYLKATKSNRSAMKRLIERKGIAGFSEDVGRVLAGFIYSNARQTSGNLHMGEMTQSLTALKDGDKTQGELLDAAVKLVDYVKNPQEEAQALRGLLFAQYIGGSVASALVNMTQPLTMTLPWLSQYGGLAKAGKQMAAALRDAGKAQTGDARLDAALTKAAEEGIVSPQEVHQLMAQAMGRGSLRAGDGTALGDAAAKAGNALSKVSLAWGKGFSLAEQFNRRITFIAAYRNAVERGLADPAGFAEQAVAETQGTYNAGNKPAWARGAVGSTVFTFKQYSIAYVEMLHRMATRGGPEGKRAATYALAILFLLSGAGGLPGADDLDDLISGLMQALGYNFDSKTKRKEILVDLLGQSGADFMERGVSGIAGVPIDVSGRLGLGNLIPGTGLLTKKTDHTRDVAEIAGPAGDFANRAFQAGASLAKGEVGKAVNLMSPVAVQNLSKAYDMANMGMYRDRSGKKVLDTDGYDAFSKALGFQPNDVKRVQDATSEVQRRVALNKMRESEIADSWAQGVFEKDDGKIRDARSALAQWNADNPSSPIRINFSQIAKRVRAMNEDKATRIAKTAPAEIRAAVRRELETVR